MARMKDLLIDIETAVASGESSDSIATRLGLPHDWVQRIVFDFSVSLQETADDSYDELERDHDEPYEPDLADSWYEDQFELDTDYR